MTWFWPWSRKEREPVWIYGPDMTVRRCTGDGTDIFTGVTFEARASDHPDDAKQLSVWGFSEEWVARLRVPSVALEFWEDRVAERAVRWKGYVANPDAARKELEQRIEKSKRRAVEAAKQVRAMRQLVPEPPPGSGRVSLAAPEGGQLSEVKG